jgi:hypothetical protein
LTMGIAICASIAILSISSIGGRSVRRDHCDAR